MNETDRDSITTIISHIHSVTIIIIVLIIIILQLELCITIISDTVINIIINPVMHSHGPTVIISGL